ncbi:hypothetical protein P171DRAFT_477189 [Karstenula rhodostoma CBS 690.94]|uniref:Uncharacterized protein n=1 Tax=Karstenula rhodostoma CBS 690.94 TaxID=1392251 RepID=A0A9P4P8L9_9PLEO|nr:hypothetical protein P171DRAFT_477189 [Karstenula rhodostoma CBS 690.94]
MSFTYPENKNMDDLTAIPTPHEENLKDVQTVAAAPLESEKISERPKKREKKNVVAIPTRLDFIDMPDKEPHWKVTHFGEAIIPSPITVLPKPLALSYRNFYNYYEEHEFIKQERLQVSYPRVDVASSLVPALLRHYFPSRDYSVREIWPGTSTGAEFTTHPVVNEVPVFGTRYWIVENKSDSAIVTMVVIVTDPEFSKLPARTQPAHLAVGANFLDSRHRLAVHGDRMARGVVVLLASAGMPIKPTFEFYSFDSSHQQKGVVIPLAVRKQDTQQLATNSISLAPEHAEQVDQMFKTIVRASYGQGAWPQALSTLSAPMAPVPVLHLPPTLTPVAPTPAFPTKRKPKHSTTGTPAPKAKRSKNIEPLGSLPLTPTPGAQGNLPLTPASSAPSSPTIAPAIAGPADQSTRHPIDVRNDKTRKMEHHEISEAYVRTVKRNRAGNLIEENGKMIPNGKSKAIRLVAELMGHTFRAPNHSRVP